MNNQKLKDKVWQVAPKLLTEKGHLCAVEMLMELGYLESEAYTDWRHCRVPYLEKVCKTNLSKLSLIMKEMRSYGREHNLKESWTGYNKWGKGKGIRLRFSKSGNPKIEKAYATHYVKR